MLRVEGGRLTPQLKPGMAVRKVVDRERAAEIPPSNIEMPLNDWRLVEIYAGQQRLKFSRRRLARARPLLATGFVNRREFTHVEYWRCILLSHCDARDGC